MLRRVRTTKHNNEGVPLQYSECEGMNHAYALYPIPEGKKVRKEAIAMVSNPSRSLPL